jgi:CHAT domain-containing protein
VDLGEAARIDLAIKTWREALRSPNRTDVKPLARALDRKIMQPVRSRLGEMTGPTRQLLIAPDGLLNLVPFAALVDQRGRYLVESFTISYLTSGRDLLRAPGHRSDRSEPLIVANPDFGRWTRSEVPADRAAKDSATADGQPADQRLPQHNPLPIFFQPLPDTEAEALTIKTELAGARVLLWKEATETEVKRVRAPRILHLATHGFFLSEKSGPPMEEARRGFSEDSSRGSDLRLSSWAARIKDPLLRSGLALAGANQEQSSEDDGVLTALEAAGLDLWGTQLVVLSACDTGVGEVKNGDGVYGLRRALVLAGSETQVMSLWPVSDRITRELMVAYYRGLNQGQGRSEALRLVQLGMLKRAKRQHPFYWAAFIPSGEWAKVEDRH